MSLAQFTDTASLIIRHLVRLDFAGIKRLGRVNTLFAPDKIVHNFSNMQELLYFTDIHTDTSKPSPLPSQPRDMPDGMTHLGQPITFDDWINHRALTAIVVIKDGAIAHEDYFQGTSPNDRRISWSMCKSVTSLLLGALIDKGLIDPSALDRKMSDIVVQLAGTGYHDASLRNVLNMASGVAFNEDYLDYNSDINRMGRVLALGGSMDEFAKSLGTEYAPNTYNHYVSIDTHVIGMAIRALMKTDILPLFITHIFDPLRLETPPYFMTDSKGEPFVLGGLNMTTRDYARIGLLIANKGMVDGVRVVSSNWITQSTRQSAPPPLPDKIGTPEGELVYGYQWWLPPDAVDGECFAIGIYGQFIYINPNENLVVAINSADVNFKDGNGAPALENIAMFRTIARHLNDAD